MYTFLHHYRVTEAPLREGGGGGGGVSEDATLKFNFFFKFWPKHAASHSFSKKKSIFLLNTLGYVF